MLVTCGFVTTANSVSLCVPNLDRTPRINVTPPLRHPEELCDEGS